MAIPMPAEWEWMTDAMKWKSYSPALSAAIEAGYQAGNFSVNLGLQSASAPTHSITFQHQPPCQVDLSLHPVLIRIRIRLVCIDHKQLASLKALMWGDVRGGPHELSDG